MLAFFNMKVVLGIVIGAAIGIGYSRLNRCRTGTCPLTSNWWLAGLYGAALGMFVMMSSAGSSAAPAAAADKAPASQSQPAATRPQGEKVMVKQINSVAEFDQEVAGATKPVLVDFYATWCGPCRFLSPVLDQIATEHPDKVEVVKVDVDKVGPLAARYRIQGVPTVMLFDGGKQVKVWVGVRSKGDYVAAIEQAAAAKSK